MERDRLVAKWRKRVEGWGPKRAELAARVHKIHGRFVSREVWEAHQATFRAGTAKPCACYACKAPRYKRSKNRSEP